VAAMNTVAAHIDACDLATPADHDNDAALAAVAAGRAAAGRVAAIETRLERSNGNRSALEAELASLRRAVAAGRAARDALVTANQRLVVSVAARPCFRGSGLDLDDRIQAGTIGLMRAVDRFDPARGTEFSTFATPYISGYIHREIANTSRAVRLPAGQHERLWRARRQAAEATQAAGEVVALEDDVPREVPLSMLLAADSVDSLDDAVSNVQDADDLGDLLADDAPGPDDLVDEVRRAEVVREVLAELPPELEQAVRVRYGIDAEQMIFSELGARCGVTAQAVQLRERRGRRLLMHPRRLRMLREVW